MTKNITLVRGDDTNFFNQTLLIISFKTVLNLDGYKLRLTIENPTNFIKSYEVQQNTVEINFDKINSSTFSVGEHRANLKLIDTLGRVKTTHTFNIMVQDEFEAQVPKINEYEIELELDADGINKYKNYNELYNKPSINDIVLEGNKTFDELGMTKHVMDICEQDIEKHNTNPKSHKDIRDQIMNKQDRLIAGSNITIIDGIISSLGAQGGVTTDYKQLGNKPRINNVVLDDNITLDQLGIQALGDYITPEILAQKGFLTSVPSGYITEEELYAENYIKKIPPEYYTNTQNQEIYATILDLDLKQNKLTAGDNITIVEEDGVTSISAQISEDYITEDELQKYGYITNDAVNKKLDRKQNLMVAGDNIRIKSNTDGTYTISAIDSKNPSEIVSYNSLNNKPTINGVSLIGNKNASELKLQPAGNYQKLLIAGDGIELTDTPDGKSTIKAVYPENLCTDDELQQGLDTKANKSTTLLGYNIEDAYTKEEIDKSLVDLIQSKVTDIILEAPNGVASYTETTITAKSGVKVLFSDGLNKDNTYKNIEGLLEQDILIDTSSLEYNDLYKNFYFVLIENNGIISATIIPKIWYNTLVTEVIPNNLSGYVKNINENKIYKMVYSENGVYVPELAHIKVIGEGTIGLLENESIRITSFTPYSVYRLIGQDEVLLEIDKLQPIITVGDNFKFENNKLEYFIPYNYVTKEYLIENDFTTQTDINDAINIHNTNNLSHQDIRKEIDNIYLNIPTKVSQLSNDMSYITDSKLNEELQPYALITDIPDAREYCTVEQYNKLLERISILENKINELLK